MNIKSLLIGSAAALAVVSGAQAADAVVAAEPEPMEYVRVCDAYGTGYFYIPGTETCLKIGGELRYEKHWGKSTGLPSSYYHKSRATIDFTAKNDSEWGTVSSWIRLRGTHIDNVGPAMNVYYTFGIGGLEFGFYDSQFAQFQGYGGRTDYGGRYSDEFDKQYISYTASFDSFSAIVSLEHDRNLNPEGVATDSKYMPDVVLGAKAAFGDWTVTAVGGYDESDDSFAIAKKVTGDLGMFGVTLEAFYGNSFTNTYWGYDGWSVLVGASANVTDSIKLAADVQYFDNDSWLVIGDVNWTVANGFSVLLEGTINDAEDKTVMLRFQRTF